MNGGAGFDKGVVRSAARDTDPVLGDGRRVIRGRGHRSGHRTPALNTAASVVGPSRPEAAVNRSTTGM
jgi:hypothetical protein